MHAMWSGSISFGLVNIPVKLYNATDDHEFQLSMLHKSDHSPIHYTRICNADGKEVPYKDIVKGYEYQKGEYVVLDNKDFEQANVRATHAIDIIEFTSEKEIDIRFFQKPYYLEPMKGTEKAYALLREALNVSKKVGLAKFVLRNREHLVLLKPIGLVLVLDFLRFPTEIRDSKGLELPGKNQIERQELNMALALIDQLTHKFNPDKFKDTYTEELQQMIEDKISGKKPSVKGKIPQPTKVKDLMTALKASLKSKVKPISKTKTQRTQPRRPVVARATQQRKRAVAKSQRARRPTSAKRSSQRKKA